MASVGDKFYRYEDMLYGSQISIRLSTYKVIKLTPKGCWIAHNYDHNHLHKRFVLSDSRKKFAYPTKEQAMESFIRRKERQIIYLQANLNRAKNALYTAKNGQRDALEISLELI